MKVLTVLVGLIGGLLAFAVTYFIWAMTFGQLGVRVPSFGILWLAATLLGLAGPITTIWAERIGGWLQFAASAALALLAALLLHWAIFGASERDAQLAGIATRSAMLICAPMVLLAITGLLSLWLVGRRTKSSRPALAPQ